MYLFPGRSQSNFASCMALVLLMAGFFSCSPGDGQAAGLIPMLEDLNVVLVVIDTLGAEHVGCLQPGLTNTPNLDALASKGVLFRRAATTAPWTQPALTSLFTSLMPSRHDVLNILDTLDLQLKTLAERMSERGFRTAGVVSHFMLGEIYGFAQGFDLFDESPAGDHQAITSHKVTDSAISLVDTMEGNPFFLFVHYFDPHFDYIHHPEFDCTSNYSGPLYPGMKILDLRTIRDSLTPEDIEYLKGLYHEEIAYTDFHLGRLLDHLEKKGMTKNTLVIVTADHGEEFMRHGWIGHTRTLYNELLHIPLIVSLPGTLPPRTIDTPVSILDIVPTLMDLSATPETDSNWEGLSLKEVLFKTPHRALKRDLFAEVSFTQPVALRQDHARNKTAIKAALLGPDLKLIHDLPTNQWELYDRLNDINDLRNLSAENHPMLGELQKRLRAWEKDRIQKWGIEFKAAPSAGEEEMEKLRNLGYIK
ncbi:MAG: sulfatase-like hydrolase/transferase [Planctomycetota bacterium]